MKRFGFGVLIVVMSLSINVFGNNIPVKIKVKYLDAGMMGMHGATVPIVEVISASNSIIIKDVIGNRGNCPMTAYRKAQFPQKLKFGELATAGFKMGCNLIEIDVVTNQGTWSWSIGN